MCRHPKCSQPRTRFSVFCEAHHREQLERVGSGAELPPKDLLRLAVGPLWLNLVRLGTMVAAAAVLDRPAAVVMIAGVSVISAAIGWRWSRRLVWQRELGFPIGFFPSPLFLVPVLLYCLALAALVAALTFAAMRGE